MNSALGWKTTLTPNQQATINILLLILSSFSVLGCLCLILAYIVSKNIRSFAMQQVICLILAELIFHISSFIPTSDGLSISCLIQTILRIYFETASLIWTSIIALTSIISIVQPLEIENNQKKYTIIFITIANIIPLIFTLMYL